MIHNDIYGNNVLCLCWFDWFRFFFFLSFFDDTNEYKIHTEIKNIFTWNNILIILYYKRYILSICIFRCSVILLFWTICYFFSWYTFLPKRIYHTFHFLNIQYRSHQLLYHEQLLSNQHLQHQYKTPVKITNDRKKKEFTYSNQWWCLLPTFLLAEWQTTQILEKTDKRSKHLSINVILPWQWLFSTSYNWIDSHFTTLGNCKGGRKTSDTNGFSHEQYWL